MRFQEDERVRQESEQGEKRFALHNLSNQQKPFVIGLALTILSGAKTADPAMVVKLTRVMLLAPVALLVAFILSPRRKAGRADRTSSL